MRIDALEAAERALFDRRGRGEVIPDHIYNQEMERLGREREGLIADREELARRVELSTSMLDRLRTQLARDAELSDDRWFALRAPYRNYVLRTFFPRGMAVLPRDPQLKPGEIAGRLSVRPT